MLDKKTIREIEVSKIRDHFESLWRSGGVKSVEQFLAGSKFSPEPDLLLSLIEAELFLKSQTGETPNARDLMRRFPKSASIVEQAFSTFNSCEESEPASLTVPGSLSKDSTAPQPPESTPELSLLDLNCSGRLLGQYELLERLGSGSMGVVVKARDSRNFDRIVALKLLNVESNEARQRFENEAKALCNLDHPSIVKLFDFGEINNICFIAMQYVDGRTLKDLPTTGEREFIELLLPVIRGVHYAHQRGIVHRDVKPSNILIDSRRRAYLTDFGLVKLQQFDGATLTNQTLGTPHFMAPEQCRNSKLVDARGDIYALGVVLYWHLAGGYPYHADSAAELQHKICFVPPLPIRERNASVSKDLETIVLKCLEKEPKHRYQAATELADDLQRFLDGRPIHARPLHPIIKAWYWSRRKPAFAGLMFLLFFSTCLGGTTALLAWKNLERQIQQTLREKELRSAAETAQAKAEVSTRLARSHQLRTALALAEVARQAGKLDEYQNSQSELSQLPDLYSVDCQWHRQQVRDSIPPRVAFGTSHWGLYDTALSPNSNYAAIADRTGMLTAYQLSTGKVVKRLAQVDVDPSLQFAWPRWLYLAVAAGLKSEKPGMELKPDRFYSSICWLDNQQLVAAGTDGSIFAFSLSDIEPAKLFQHDKALHWVRYCEDRLMAADVDGELILLERNTGGSKENDHNFVVSARLKLNSPVSFLAYSTETQHWVVGTLGGELRLFDHSLQPQLELSLQTQIHDARVWKTRGTGHCLLVAAKNRQLRAWNLEKDMNNSSLSLSQEQIFKRSDVSGPSACVRAIIDRERVVGLNNRGEVNVWRLADQSPEYSFIEMCSTESRGLDGVIEQMKTVDELELRAPCHLLPHELGTISVDLMGTFRIFDLDGQLPRWWQKSTLTLGPRPRIVGDKRIVNQFWTLDELGCLSVVNLQTNQLISRIEQAHQGGRAAIEAMANGDVVTVGNDSHAKIWSLVGGTIREVRRLSCQGELCSIAVHEPTSRMAGVTTEGNLAVWDLATGQLLHERDFSADAGTIATETQATQPDDPNSSSGVVFTGALDFSKSGEYLCYFGEKQNQTCIRTTDWSMVDLRLKGTGGDGGEAVAFSPRTEHLLIDSWSKGASFNSVQRSSYQDWETNLHVTGLPRLIDFAVTQDRRRLLGLQDNGRIVSLSAEFPIQIATLPGAAEAACSLAVSCEDMSLATTHTDGSVYWYPLRTWRPMGETVWKSKGVAHKVAGGNKYIGLRQASLNGQFPLLDRNGHSTELFLAGDIINTGPENRAYRLNKANGVWQLLPLRFEGDATGPVLHGQLFRNRVGKLHAVLRQGKLKSSDYNGRILLAQETDDAAQPWSIEVIQAAGNQGFAPWVEFDEKGQVQKIIQLDYELQRLKQHHRPSTPTLEDWPGKVVVGFAGTIHDIKGMDGRSHFLISRLQGFDAWPPYIYTTLEGDPAETAANTLARIPLLVTQDHLIGWNERYRELYALSFVDKTWRKIQSLPAELPLGMNPFFDAQGRLWWPIPAGNQIKLIGLDINKLIESPSNESAEMFMYALVELDSPIAPDCHISGRLSGFGHLEFVILNQNSDIQLGVIESEEPFLRN